MTDKKMTTGGFFRALAKYALGADVENPVHTVIKKGLANGSQTKVIETEAQEQEASQGRNQDHEGTSGSFEASQAPKTQVKA